MLNSGLSHFRGIHGKLLGLTLGVSLASIVLVSGLILKRYEHSLMENVKSDLVKTTSRAVSQVEAEFKPIEQIVSLLASVTPVLSMKQSDIIRELKRDEFNMVFSLTEKIAVLDSSGKELATNYLNNVLLNREQELKLNDYTERRTSVYYTHNVTWRYNIPHTSIVQSFQGFSSNGYVTADVSYRRLWDIVNEIKIAKTVYAFVVDGNGILVAHPDKRKIQSLRNDTAALSVFKAQPHVDSILKKSHLGYIEYEDDSGVKYFASYQFIPRYNLGVVVTVPVAEIIAEVNEALYVLILIVIAIVLIAVSVTILVTKKLVTPIKQITHATRRIAEGHFSDEITIKTGRDEVGYLAQNVEFMRAKLKNYTEDLEFMVEEKIQQLKEIMDNIYQGLFTINLDGTVNPECSMKTVEILGLTQFEHATLQEIFRLDDDEYRDFISWLEVVKKKYRKMRWGKLQRLLSLTHLKVHSSDGSYRHVELSFQPLYDQKTSELNKIMVLANDITEDIEVERRIEAEREKNEREVKTIIALARNSRMLITDFLADSYKRIRYILSEMEHIKNDYQTMLWMDELHTIKGNAGSLGFVEVSLAAHKAEDDIQRFKSNKNIRSEWIGGFKLLLEDLLDSLDKLEDLFELLFKSEEEYMDISKEKIATINRVVKQLNSGFDEDLFNELILSCEKIQYKSAQFLTRKYYDLAEKFYKRIFVPSKLEVISSELDLNPDTFSRFDDAIVQLIKNAFDHGSEGVKDGVFVVKLIYNRLASEEQIIVRDNGVGMDPEAIAHKAVEQKLIDKSDLDRFSPREKLNLIFLQEFSQRDDVSVISGRGVGLSIVKKKVEALGATIDVSSARGEGSVFTIRLPRKEAYAKNSSIN